MAPVWLEGQARRPFIVEEDVEECYSKFLLRRVNRNTYSVSHDSSRRQQGNSGDWRGWLAINLRKLNKMFQLSTSSSSWVAYIFMSVSSTPHFYTSIVIPTITVLKCHPPRRMSLSISMKMRAFIAHVCKCCYLYSYVLHISLNALKSFRLIMNLEGRRGQRPTGK